MNRFFKIAGDFLESVDQRADRSVNSSTQPPTYKTRVVENRSQAAASAAVSSRLHERYTPKNPRTRTSSGNQRNPVSPVIQYATVKKNEEKKADMEVEAIIKSMNTEDISHKRSISEQFPQNEESKDKVPERIISTNEISVQANIPENEIIHSEIEVVEETEEKNDKQSHTWGEDENEVGLHITASVDPSFQFSPSIAPITTLEEAQLHIHEQEPITVDDLQNHIEDLEHDLDEALAQIDANTQALEDKDMRIDILENRLKQMRIDSDRTKEKTDVLIDEKDSIIMKQKTEMENLKAEYYRFKLEWNEEKQKAEKGTQKAEKEVNVFQMQLKQLEEQNSTLKNQLLQLTETMRKEEEKSHSIIKEKERRIEELETSLASSQKQIEDVIMRFDNHESQGEEYNEKIGFLEKELLKVRQEKDKLIQEQKIVNESTRVTVEEYKSIMKKYEEQLQEKDKQIQELKKQEEIVNMNKQNSYSLLQTQIEQLQQTVLKKQLMLDAVNSEKSSLEYRLADVLRDKAKTESLRRLGTSQRDEWCDIERGEEEEKTHTRSIARILPDNTPTWILEKVDDVDDISLTIIQFLQRSPSFRLLFLLYLIFLHIGFFILFLRKKLYVC